MLHNCGGRPPEEKSLPPAGLLGLRGRGGTCRQWCSSFISLLTNKLFNVLFEFVSFDWTQEDNNGQSLGSWNYFQTILPLTPNLKGWRGSSCLKRKELFTLRCATIGPAVFAFLLSPTVPQRSIHNWKWLILLMHVSMCARMLKYKITHCMDCNAGEVP